MAVTYALRHCEEPEALLQSSDIKSVRGSRVSKHSASLFQEHSMFAHDMRIASFDPALAQAIAAERQRQEDHIELIASENHTSPRVLEAAGSLLTNKYAEGYPG